MGMSESRKLKVSFDELEHGWIVLAMEVGEESFRLVASYVPFDSISELAATLNQLLSGDLHAVVRWNEEPAQYEMSFIVDDAQIRVEVSQVKSVLGGIEREFLFGFSEEYTKVLVAFWRALRELQGRYEPAEYQRRWHQPFPTREMEVLTERITAWKSSQCSR
jgi:hypothetical protein